MQKVEILPHPNGDFQKFPQKYMTRNIENFEKDWMICKIIEEITRNQPDLENVETASEF